MIIAGDGIEALRMLRETSNRAALPDLILLDWNMPRQNGLQILTELKSDPALKPIPVLVMTSSMAARDISNAYGLHANCYITKPMDMEGFTATLRDIEGFWFSRAVLPSQYS